MNPLAGKTALVTGASRGIGRATAFALANAGAEVLVHYNQSNAEAEAVVAEIANADLGAPHGAHELAQKVRAIVGGRLDVLLANAGIGGSYAIEEISVEAFDRLFAINVRAPFFLVQQLLPVLGTGSNVILVSSLAAHAAIGTVAAYAATKGAIDTLVTHFAAALGGRGIRVNAVAPGVIDTDISNFTKTAEGRNFAMSIQTLKRIAQPADVAEVVRFLASEDARWVTGQVVRVDGGSKL
jgi:3-oxoacyl-[acyl-carrier protein] reductase